ncbi:MAG: hydroxymethylglutaryl-CoA lyase [Saprospiraceae bacterium]|nr:hydroxymethylglutaryl-CoA lyase [Saprospiraceae bacterium]
MVQLIECPRDAMQGLPDFIPTDVKAAYINQLLKVGFHSIDFGSFVSAKAIPQMRDTVEVLSKLDLSNTATKLLAIVANERGAAEAVEYKEITYLGYPFSVSETFQLRNTNASISESVLRVEAIQELSIKHNKQLVLYISMGFGNPYGDDWNAEVVMDWVGKLAALDIKIFSLSDTVGVSNPESIRYLFSNLIPAYPNLDIGAHLHTQPHNWREKVHAAYTHGCTRFDAAMKGFGGCPMAKDDLTGNMATENLVSYFSETNVPMGINFQQFIRSLSQANDVFPH